MYKISGKHSIISAHKNPKRKNKTFSGTKDYYDSLKINCKYVASKKNCLLVEEICILASFQDMLDCEKIILLDEVIDVGNLASIIRSAAILNYGVILKKCCRINEKALEMACGGFDSTPIYIMNNNITNQIKALKQHFSLYALDEKGSILDMNNQSHRHILLVGSEQNGICRNISKYVDYFIKLKSPKNFNTFNASVAAAIGMYIMN